MPRNMSFMLTTEQVRNKTKTVTRRLGWWNLKEGDIVNACVKCMGLKKGEKVEKICQIRIKNVRKERINQITDSDLIKEGFPDWNRYQFIKMFLDSHKCKTGVVTPVNRIEFEYL
jgi:hypothetical protein